MEVPLIINSSSKAYSLLKKHINPNQEEVWLLSLNSELKLIELDMLFRGTAQFCPFHMRDLVRTLCLRNACSFILAHNHPSGNFLPSRQDLLVTRKIKKIAGLIEIQYHDHLVITHEGFSSLEKNNILNPS